MMENDKIKVIFDTDANNELDDQHALAYLIFNSGIFDILGVTVNATQSGGGIDEHYKEAERIMHLCSATGIPLLKGADANYLDIVEESDMGSYDGQEAVDFIITEARKVTEGKLTLLAVGKLTNVALAVHLAPGIASKIKLVWLGSNYPEPGEYNLVNDIPAMNYLLGQHLEFEMVMVRYGEPTGSDAVRVTPEIIEKEMKGTGPESTPVTGRDGGEFTRFGDYSINLFNGIDLYGDPPARALFDMVAVAIVKNPSWGQRSIIKGPIMVNEQWTENPDVSHDIVIWENFNKEAILEDFFESMHNPVLPVSE